jgi:hypothetical protein
MRRRKRLIISGQFTGNYLQACLFDIGICYSIFFCRIGQVVTEQFRLPWLRNPTILSLTALGKERDQLLKTLHGFTEEVSQYYMIELLSFF